MRNLKATPQVLHKLKEEENMCNQCKKPLPEEHEDWYPIEYYCGIEDVDGNDIKVHGWLCPDCGLSMLKVTVNKSFDMRWCLT